MRGLIHVVLMGGLCFAFERADAREWVSRDGRFTVEAELLTVEANQVVLRREAGSVIRVPMERLSLGDVKYVQEALQAASLTTPPDKAPTAGAEAAPSKTAAGASPQPSVGPAEPEPNGPPLAQPGSAQWQAAPDPAHPGFDLEPGSTAVFPTVCPLPFLAEPLCFARQRREQGNAAALGSARGEDCRHDRRRDCRPG